MPGYVGFLIDINDDEKFSEYARATAPTMAKHGGAASPFAARSATSSRDAWTRPRTPGW